MQGVVEPRAPVPMVSDGKSTIFEDQRATPESGSGSKARDVTSTYEDNTYEEADKKDGSSSRPRAVHNEVHSEGQARAPGVGQNADKMWAQMPNSPRLLETIDATVRNTPALCGPASPRTTRRQKSIQAPPQWGGCESVNLSRTPCSSNARPLRAQRRRETRGRRRARVPLP